MTKKFITLIIVSMMLLALSACGSSSGAETARKAISKDAEILWETDDFKVYMTKVNPELQIYEFEGSFQDGLLRVRNASGLYGYIDNTGALAIPFQYASANEFSEGLARVGFDATTSAYINTKGEVVISFERDRGGAFSSLERERGGVFSEGLVAVDMDGGWGYIDTNGKVVISGQYRNANAFSEGFAAVEVEGYRWGFIDKTGTVVVPTEYVSVGTFHEGLAPASSSDDFGGVVNTKGELIIPCKYLMQSSYSPQGGSGLHELFRDGLIILENYDSRDKYLYDANGNVILELGSRSVSVYWANGLVIVKTTPNSFACYDYKGNPVSEPGVVQKFADPTRSIQINFPEGGDNSAKQLFYIHRSGKDWGVADIDGNMIIEQKYDGIGRFYNGIAFAWFDNEVYLVDEKGNAFNFGTPNGLRLPIEFDDGGLALAYSGREEDFELYILEKQ